VDDAAAKPESPRVRVAVCMCTYRRPDVLRRLLNRIVEIAADAADLAEVGVVVVDDDTDASAKATTAEFENVFALGVAYENTASGNISVARNRALERGIEMADWLALIDDDCTAGPDWLRQLLAVQSAFDAECVSGHCIDVPPDGAPAWLTAEPFLDEFDAGDDGAVIVIGPLKNTLIAADFLRRTGLRFDPAMGRIGGEDASFFYAANAAGLRHRYADVAVVREEVPADRATLRYQLRRRYWYGNTEAVTSIASGRYSRPRILVSGLKRTAAAVARPVTQLARRRRPQVRYALAETLRGLGRILGALGLRVKHH